MQAGASAKAHAAPPSVEDGTDNCADLKRHCLGSLGMPKWASKQETSHSITAPETPQSKYPPLALPAKGAVQSRTAGERFAEPCFKCLPRHLCETDLFSCARNLMLILGHPRFWICVTHCAGYHILQHTCLSYQHSFCAAEMHTQQQRERAPMLELGSTGIPSAAPAPAIHSSDYHSMHNVIGSGGYSDAFRAVCCWSCMILAVSGDPGYLPSLR